MTDTALPDGLETWVPDDLSVADVFDTLMHLRRASGAVEALKPEPFPGDDDISLFVVGGPDAQMGGSLFARKILPSAAPKLPAPPGANADASAARQAFADHLVASGAAHFAHPIAPGGAGCAALDLVLRYGATIVFDDADDAETYEEMQNKLVVRLFGEAPHRYLAGFKQWPDEAQIAAAEQKGITLTSFAELRHLKRPGPNDDPSELNEIYCPYFDGEMMQYAFLFPLSRITKDYPNWQPSYRADTSRT